MAFTRQQLLDNFARAEAMTLPQRAVFQGSRWGKFRRYPLHVLLTKLLFTLWPRAQHYWLVKNRLFTGDSLYTEGYCMDYYLCGIFAEPSERALTKWLLQNVGHSQQPEVFFDVGAHYGYYSMVVAAVLADQPHAIYAFEPTPTTHKVLQKNLRACSSAQAVHTALGEHSGQRALNTYIAAGSCSSNSFFANDALQQTGDRPLARVDVPIQTLDQFCQTHDIWPTLIKLDIENGELDALRGARHVLQQARPCIAMEVWPHPYNERHQQAAHLLRSLGYTLHRLDSCGNTQVIDADTWFTTIHHTENILAIL